MKRDIFYFMNEFIDVSSEYTIDKAAIQYMLDRGMIYNAVICLAMMVGGMDNVKKQAEALHYLKKLANKWDHVDSAN